MDCSSEEQMIRMRLESFDQVKQLSFDIPNRLLEVFHTGEVKLIQEAIRSLKMNDTLIDTEKVEAPTAVDDSTQRKMLWWVLELILGFSSLK